MIKIEKTNTELGVYKIYIKDLETNNILIMYYSYNGDLYWSLYSENSNNNIGNVKYFPITKENYELYLLFNNLFDCMKNVNLQLQPMVNNGYNMDPENPYATSPIVISTRNKLLNSNVIEWVSEEAELKYANHLRIVKNLNEYSLFFEKKNPESVYYNICFRNNGSKYAPFNALFMQLFNSLENYDPEYHQIHMEEYLYHKLLLKK